MKKLWLARLLVVSLALTACKDSPSDPGDNGGNNGGNNNGGNNGGAVAWANGPVTMPVLGRGLVTERVSAEIAVNGTTAYTTSWGARLSVVNGQTVSTRGNAVKIWDVSGATPVLVDSLIIANVGTTSDVQISEDKKLLVVSTEGPFGVPGQIVMYDLTNPRKPTQVGRFTSANTSAGVHTVKLGHVNGRHYAFLNIDPGAAPATLVIADITDPANPTEVFHKAMGRPFIHDVWFKDGLLFAALWDDGMTIFDVGAGTKGGSPSNPVQIGNVVTKPGIDPRAPSAMVHNVYWYQDPTTGSKKYAFIGQEGGATIGSFASGDIHVVDVSDMANPREVAFFAVQGAGVHNFAVDEQNGILYAAYYNAGVRALDIRGDLGSCTDAQKTADGRCDLSKMGREAGRALVGEPVYIWGVALQGTNLYASDMGATQSTGGIIKINASQMHR